MLLDATNVPFLVDPRKVSANRLVGGAVTMNHFEILRVLGKGAFGKVHAVQRRDTKELFAMKVMDKVQILDEKMVDQVLNERYMMAQLHYPLVVNLRFAAQDPLDLFLVVDLMLGGDLRYHMKPGRVFDDNRIRFYAAQTALAINYIHTSGYIHRDIKPDNLLLDGNGNVHLTDFNLSVKSTDPRRRGVVGTRSYMAPEVVSRQQYNEMVDWWSLGICIFEWAIGTVPFRGSTEEQKEAILTAEPRFPSGLNKNLRSLLILLLKKDPVKRGNLAKMKEHAFFEGVDWVALEQKQAEAPWKPDATRANCDGTYDLDEQFQVKRKRQPVDNPCFNTWDWKPGQASVETPRSGRKSNASAKPHEEEPSAESDGAISDERPKSADVSSDLVEPSNSGRITSESIASVDSKDSKRKHRKSKVPEPESDESTSDTTPRYKPVSKEKGVKVQDHDDTRSTEDGSDDDSEDPSAPQATSPSKSSKTGTAPVTSASSEKSKSSKNRKHESVPAALSTSDEGQADKTSKKKASKRHLSSEITGNGHSQPSAETPEPEEPSVRSTKSHAKLHSLGSGSGTPTGATDLASPNKDRRKSSKRLTAETAPASNQDSPPSPRKSKPSKSDDNSSKEELSGEATSRKKKRTLRKEVASDEDIPTQGEAEDTETQDGETKKSRRSKKQ